MTTLPQAEAVGERMRQVHQQGVLWRELVAAMREDSHH
jgi:hypothetical protein